MQRDLWIGLAEVQTTPGVAALDGAAMAFVQVLGRATSPTEFCRSVRRDLARLELTLVSLEDVELYSEAANRMQIRPELKRLAMEAARSDECMFDEFHAFDE